MTNNPLSHVVALLWLLLLTGTQSAVAQPLQKFSVESFELDPFDTSAQDDKYRKEDGNGDLYAIIKVTSDNPDDKLQEFFFDFGNMNHLQQGVHDQELWLYVQRNAKHVTIQRKGYATVRRYGLSTVVEKGRTYRLHLSVTQAPIYTQMVQFAIMPADAKAVVMVQNEKDGSPEELFGNADSNGGVAKSLPLGSYTFRIMAQDYHTSEGRFDLTDRTQTHKETIELRPNFSEVTLKVDADADIYVNGEKRGHRSWTGRLKAGSYQVECQQADHRNSSQVITVGADDNRIYDLTRPIPITGTLSVVSRPLGATIVIDGKDYGLTPQNINDLIIGRHNVTLSLKNYESQTLYVEVEENKQADLDIDLGDEIKPIVKPKTQKPTVEKPKTEKPKPEKPKPLKQDRQAAATTYLRPTSFYIEGAAQAGTMMGAGGNVGLYLSNVNIEGFLTTVLGSENAYLNYGGTYYTEETLKGLMLGARVGYGIALGPRLRLTPQVGLGSLSVKSTDITATALCATVGLRAEFALTSFLGISLTPEGQFAASKKDVFDQLATLSSTVKGWGTGFNARLGLYIYF